jgi:mannosyltransferase OCH1-like enzyme
LFALRLLRCLPPKYWAVRHSLIHLLTPIRTMAIPKVIYQTYKTAQLPPVTRFFVNIMRRRNPHYQYEFYDDERIKQFFLDEYGPEVAAAYRRIAIGAAKADFFRYAVLYRFGGIYLDIDGYTLKKLDNMLLPDDSAVITSERNPGLYVQWALVYDKGHPFLKRTMEKVLDNIRHNRYPHDVHRMTGPSVYSAAINECIAEGIGGNYRVLGVDYNGFFKDKHPLNKGLYGRGEHWRKQQLERPVLHLHQV